MKGLFLGIFLLLTLSGIAEEPVSLSFQMIQTAATPFNGQTVSIRGFLYRSPEGIWVLSSEANLKSCCVGAPEKKLSQVFVEGISNNPVGNRAVTLRGTFSVKPSHNDQGEPTQLYSLQNATFAKKEEASLLKIGAGIIGALAIGFGTVPYLRRRMKGGG